MSKPPFNFKPAPRPAVDPDLARQMAAESADLGFTRTTSAPKPDVPTEGATAPLAEGPVEQPAERATAQPAEGEKAPSVKGTVARSAERAKARRANIAMGQGRNVSVARPPDGATAQTAKGPFAPVAGTVKLEVQDPLWTELRVAAAKRRVSIRYLVHEALAAQGYTVNLDEIPPDGRRVR